MIQHPVAELALPDGRELRVIRSAPKSGARVEVLTFSAPITPAKVRCVERGGIVVPLSVVPSLIEALQAALTAAQDVGGANA